MGDTYREGKYGHTWLSEDSLLIERRVLSGEDIGMAKERLRERAERIASELGEDWKANTVKGRGKHLLVTVSRTG